MPAVSLQKGKTPSPKESHWYDTKLSDNEVSGALRNVEYPFIAITPRFTLTQNRNAY